MYNDKYAGADEVKNPKLNKKNPEPGISILEVLLGGPEEIDFVDRLKTHLAKTYLEMGDEGEISMHLGPNYKNEAVIQLKVKKLKNRQLTNMTVFAQAAYFGFRIGMGE